MSQLIKAAKMLFAVAADGDAWVIRTPQTLLDDMDGTNLNDNCFKDIPKEPGVYLATAEEWFQQGYYEGYPADGESDVWFVLTECTKLPEAPEGEAPSEARNQDLRSPSMNKEEG